MNVTYSPSPEQFRQTPASVEQRLRVTERAELLLLTATNQYVRQVPESSAKHIALNQTIEFTQHIAPVDETPVRMPGYQPQQSEVMTREEMLAHARSQINEVS